MFHQRITAHYNKEVVGSGELFSKFEELREEVKKLAKQFKDEARKKQQPDMEALNCINTVHRLFDEFEAETKV